MRDIAKQTGVSIASVSRALNNHPSVSDELRNRVIEAANSQRYVFNAGKREASNIAYVYTGGDSLDSPFDLAVLKGLYDSMADSNLHLMILNVQRIRRNDEDYSQTFRRLGVRGAVLRTSHGTRSTCEKIIAQKFPAVVVGDRLDGAEASCVFSESRAASREAVEYLITLGHRRIAVSTNIVEDSDHQERLAGYREAHENHGLEVDKSLVMRAPGNRDGGSQLIRRVATAADRPTAIYITDPDAAVGALCEAQKIGLRVPVDMSIVGFDDAEMRHIVQPTMTAVCQDATGLGREAYQVLSGLISKQAKATRPRNHTLPTWFEVHSTTGPCGHG